MLATNLRVAQRLHGGIKRTAQRRKVDHDINIGVLRDRLAHVLALGKVSLRCAGQWDPSNTMISTNRSTHLVHGDHDLLGAPIEALLVVAARGLSAVICNRRPT